MKNSSSMRDALAIVFPGSQFMKLLIHWVSSAVAMSNGCDGVRCAWAVTAIADSAKTINVDFLFIVFSFINTLLGSFPATVLSF